MKVAVIGSGISGLSAAYFLSKKYNVDLFEKDNHFGGHSYTVDIPEKNNDRLIKVAIADKTHLACVNKEGKLLIFKIDDLPSLKKGGGVQLQKIKKNNLLSDIQIFNIDEGISWKTGSLNKNLKEIDFWLGKRSQSGKKIPKRFNKNFKFYD